MRKSFITKGLSFLSFWLLSFSQDSAAGSKLPPGNTGISPPNYFKTLGPRKKKTKNKSAAENTTTTGGSKFLATSRRGSYSAAPPPNTVNSIRPPPRSIPLGPKPVRAQQHQRPPPPMKTNNFNGPSAHRSSTYHQPTVQVGYKHNWNSRRQRKSSRPAPAIEMLGAAPNVTQMYTHPKVKHRRNNNSLFAPSYPFANVAKYDTFLPMI